MDQLPPPRIDLLVHAPTPQPLAQALAQLLEPSAALYLTLAPALHEQLKVLPKPRTYAQLLTQLYPLVLQLPLEAQVSLLHSHPRIGQQGPLSAASASEQAQPAPGEVLKRLTVLQSLYESLYPELKYVVFVNGRSKLQIAAGMEALLQLDLPPPSSATPEPSLASLRASPRAAVKVLGSSAWRQELTRGLENLFLIAQSRLDKMGVA